MASPAVVAILMAHSSPRQAPRRPGCALNRFMVWFTGRHPLPGGSR